MFKQSQSIVMYSFLHTLAIVVLTVNILFGCVSSQGFLILPNGADNDSAPEKQPAPMPTRRPYRPLRPMQLPPHFQNLGITLPPPPLPPLAFHEPSLNVLVELGQPKIFQAFFHQMKPLLFPWMNKPTTSEATATTPPPTPTTTLPTASTAGVSRLPQD